MSEEDRAGAALPEPGELEALGSACCGEHIHCLTVAGEIEGHTLLPASVKTTKYEHVMPLLAAVEESPEIRGLLILVNTVGGDVEAGLAIAELIAGMKTPTASLVLGGGHSIGVPLAAAARRSFIAPSAAMTLHPVRLTGVVIGVPQTYSYLARVQQRIVRFITGHSRIGEAALTSLMLRTGELAGDVGSVVEGAEAVRLGLIDAVGGLSDALDYLHGAMGERDRST
ncbi:MAG: ATP-dependent Clp protease proteolytic subunit [Oscillospiraceae bacterium]|nr:ATP-dependent Clp protease proteolytic subunit [Oscillospiraceae bacterium]